MAGELAISMAPPVACTTRQPMRASRCLGGPGASRRAAHRIGHWESLPRAALVARGKLTGPADRCLPGSGRTPLAGIVSGVDARHTPRELRASDADRERVVAVLAQAAADGRISFAEHAERTQRAYAARTLGELAVLTQDLAGPDEQPLRLEGSRVITAWFTTERREGRWVVPDRLVITAIGGQVVLDLREALLHRPHTIMYATALGGQVNLLVPPGITVITRSLAGGPPPGPDGAAGPPGPPAAPPGTPVIELHTLAVLGRIHVRTPRPRRGGLFRRPR
jgi:DUF1707 SHOCT-like domain